MGYSKLILEVTLRKTDQWSSSMWKRGDSNFSNLVITLNRPDLNTALYEVQYLYNSHRGLSSLRDTRSPAHASVFVRY